MLVELFVSISWHVLEYTTELAPAVLIWFWIVPTLIERITPQPRPQGLWPVPARPPLCILQADPDVRVLHLLRHSGLNLLVCPIEIRDNVLRRLLGPGLFVCLFVFGLPHR